MGKVEAFFKAASGSKYNDMCLLAVRSGTRRSELLGLTRRDIDIEGKRVYCVRGAHRIASKKVTYESKRPARGRHA